MEQASGLVPQGGLLLEEWAESSDPDIRQALVENLRKKRLEEVDADRVARLLEQLGA